MSNPLKPSDSFACRNHEAMLVRLPSYRDCAIKADHSAGRKPDGTNLNGKMIGYRMCKAYDELNDDQKDMFDNLAQAMTGKNPVAWLPIIGALKDHFEIEAISQVPFQRPENFDLKIAG